MLYVHKNVDLLFLTDTWLNPNVVDSNFCPSGYNIIRNDRRGTGQVLLLKTL